MPHSNPQTPAQSSSDSDPPKPGGRSTPSRVLIGHRRIAEGVILGALAGLCASELGLSSLIHARLLQDAVLLPALAGALLALSPARALVRWIAGFLLACVLLVSWTPIADGLVHSLIRSDPLQPAPAVVVLSTRLYKDGTLDAGGQERVLQCCRLLRRGYSSRLVLTRSIPDIGDESPAIIAQMRELGFNYPTDVVGPVSNTHDEAVAVARLARERGWKRIILVTHPWHMARARGVFLKAGVDVICSPCDEGSYDLSDLTGPGGRLRAFRDWLHESIGIGMYRLRGWL